MFVGIKRKEKLKKDTYLADSISIQIILIFSLDLEYEKKNGKRYDNSRQNRGTYKSDVIEPSTSRRISSLEESENGEWQRFVEETSEKQLEEEGRTRKRARKDIWQTHLYGRAVKALL